MNGKGLVGVLVVIAAPVAIVSLILWVFFFGGAGASAATCAVAVATPIKVEAIPSDAQVGAYSAPQIVNAAHVANAALALGLPAPAQLLGVQAAMGESSLWILDYGDASGPDSRGLFQQRANGAWGSYTDRMDPTISSTNFFTALSKVEGWESMDPSLAINHVQHNADPNHYRKYRTDAVAMVAFLAGVAPDAVGGCEISDDAATLAAGLVGDMDAGKLVLDPSRGYAQQIRNVADGTAAADCGLDVRILQIITIAVQNFDIVGVSDLNRRCTGSILGAGTESWHYRDGGGRAVDFNLLNGSALTGGDPNSLRLLSILDPMVPPRTGLGQVQCRAATTYQHFYQFEDRCNHLHVDVGLAEGPVVVG